MPASREQLLSHVLCAAEASAVSIPAPWPLPSVLPSRVDKVVIVAVEDAPFKLSRG